MVLILACPPDLSSFFYTVRVDDAKFYPDLYGSETRVVRSQF